MPRPPTKSIRPYTRRRHFAPPLRAALALTLACADVGHLFGEVLAARGLTHRRHNILRMLRGARSGALSHAEIAERLLVRAPDVTRLVDPMVEAGWVARKRSESGRRVVPHRLTRRGAELLRGLDQPMGAIHTWIGEVLGDDLAALVALCERLISAAAKAAEAPAAGDAA